MNKAIVVWFLGGLMLMLTLSSAFAAQELSPGTNSTFEYDGTGNETFICQVPSVHEFNVTVPSGESLTQNSTYCSLVASCEGAPVNQTLCTISETLGPGDRLQKESGACNIDVRVEDVDECPDIASYNHVEDFRAYTTSSEVVIEYMGEVVRLPKNGTLDYQAQAQFKCPVGDIQGSLSGEELLRVCQETLPQQSEYISVLLDSTLRNAERVETCSQSRSDDLAACERTKAGVNEEKTACQARLNECLDDEDSLRDEVVETRGSRNAWVMTSVFLILFFGISVLCNVVLLVRARPPSFGGGAL